MSFAEHWRNLKRPDPISEEGRGQIPKRVWLVPMVRDPIVLDFNTVPRFANLVTGRFRAVVESLEPGVHDFIPVTASWLGQDIPIDDDFYFLHVRQHANWITDTENCNWHWVEKDISGGFKSWEFTAHGYEDQTRAIFMDRIEGLHLYRGGDSRHNLPMTLLISPVLMKALKAAKLTKLTFDYPGGYYASPRLSPD